MSIKLYRDEGYGLHIKSAVAMNRVLDSGRPENMVMETLLEGYSVAATQYPTGLGVTQRVDVEYGPAIVIPSCTLAATGIVTFTQPGAYRVKTHFQFGRTGAAGTSILLFRSLVDDVQLNSALVIKVDKATALYYVENTYWVEAVAGTTFHTEVMRDLSGNNSGGLISFIPTDEGTDTWSYAPTAALHINRWAPTPTG
jgi:hypothetical protein